LRTKEQDTLLILHEHDDDDDEREEIREDGRQSIRRNMMLHVTELLKSRRLCLFWDMKSAYKICVLIGREYFRNVWENLESKK
jgi:hypothetical protein